jgi:His Kinase A (phospho-acceptor) domain
MERWLEPFAEVFFRRSADTAHDLKTPLNIAVLNLELLRMRARKISGGEEDPKLAAYAEAVEQELRRLGRIFDVFFVYALPPKGQSGPESTPVAPILEEVAALHSLELAGNAQNLCMPTSSVRARELLKLYLEGGLKIFSRDSVVLDSYSRESGDFVVRIRGTVAAEDIEVEKIFKLYYSDPSGSPELSLAAARLIAETCGGQISMSRDGARLSLELSLPVGDE